MNMFKNYLKVCFYGVRNMRCARLFAPGNTFYFHNFTLSYQNKNNVVEEITKHSGTLFHIQSTSGKIIE